MTPKARKPKPLPETIQIAIAIEKLRVDLDRKCRRLKVYNPLGDRGTPCAQLIGDGERHLLFLMEAGYRGALYPRLLYVFPDQPNLGILGSVVEARRLERAHRDTVIARGDLRPAAILTSHGLAESIEHYASPLLGSVDLNYTDRSKALGRLTRAAWMWGNGEDAEAAVLRDKARAFDPKVSL